MALLSRLARIRPSVVPAIWWVGLLIPYNPAGHLLQKGGFVVVALLAIVRLCLHPDLVWARLWTHRRLLGSLAALLAWLTASITWSATPKTSLGDLLVWYLCGIVYVTAVITVVDHRDLRILAVGWSVGAVLLALTGIPDLFTSVDPDDPLSSAAGRMAGAAGDPNILGAGCLAGIWLLVGISGWLRHTYGRTVTVVTLLPSFALLALGVVMSESRGALVAVVVSVVMALYVFRRHLRPAYLVLGAAVLVIAYRVAVDSGRVRLLDFSDGGQGRSDLWRAALQMALHHPVFGVGVGGFGPSAKQYLLEIGQITDSNALTMGLEAHNTYLQAAAEAGLVGAVLLLIFLGLTGRQLVMTMRQRRDIGQADQVRLLQGLLLALITLAVCAFFVSMGKEYRTWALLALVPVATQLSAEHRPSRPESEGESLDACHDRHHPVL